MNGAPSANESASTGPKIVTTILIIFVIVLGLFLIFFGSIIFEGFTTIYQADEGFKRAQKTINPEELRRWALQTFKEHSGTNNPEIPVSEIPKNIQNLYSGGPESAVISQNPGVIIFWGGGFFHWVIQIGDTNFSKPYINQYSDYKYNFEWTNGIYYSRETSWGLW